VEEKKTSLKKKLYWAKHPDVLITPQMRTVLFVISDVGMKFNIWCLTRYENYLLPCYRIAFSPIAGCPLGLNGAHAVGGRWLLERCRGDAGKVLVAPCWKSQVRDPGLIWTSLSKAGDHVLT